MKTKYTKIGSLAATATVLLLLVSSAAFAYTTRTLATNNDNRVLDSNDQTSSSSSNSQTQTNDNQEHELNFKLISVQVQGAPAGYRLGHGEAKIDIDGTFLKVTVELEDANPSTTYGVHLSVNGTDHSIGTLATNEKGEGKLETQLQLKPATYELGVTVDDTSTFTAPTLVLKSDPPSRVVTVPQTETKSETENETSSTHESSSSTSSSSTTRETREEQEEHELKFRIVPAEPKAQGQGEANIAIHGLTLDVHVEIEKANANTAYTVVLSLNGTDHTVGSIVTNREGNGEIKARFHAPQAGTFEVGITLTIGTTTALKSEPTIRTAILAQAKETKTETETEETHSVHTVTGDQRDEDEIKHDEDNKTIPAVVIVSSTGVSASTLDARFSVSVGRLEDNGIAVSISATNVTGPKVLLINLTRSSLADLSDHSLVVTLDGKQVAEASSIAQVLSPSPTDPARFIVIITSSGTQLLVSIPHFSLHVIQVLPAALAPPQGFLAPNGTTLLVSALAIVAIVAAAAALAKRKRISPK